MLSSRTSQAAAMVGALTQVSAVYQLPGIEGDAALELLGSADGISLMHTSIEVAGQVELDYDAQLAAQDPGRSVPECVCPWPCQNLTYDYDNCAIQSNNFGDAGACVRNTTNVGYGPVNYQQCDGFTKAGPFNYTDGCNLFCACSDKCNPGLGVPEHHRGVCNEPSAKGDPHVKNAAGDSFDVNMPGNYTMLQMPADGPPALKLSAQIKSVGNPCSLFITEATLQGNLLGNGTVRFRSSRHNPSKTQREPDVSFAAQLEEGGAWVPLEDFRSGEEAQLKEFESGHVKVVINGSRAAKAPHGGFFAVAITVPGQPEPNNHALIKVSKQRHWMNIEVFRLGLLGYANVGGVMGTEKPKTAWLESSRACQAFRQDRQNKSGAVSLLQGDEEQVEEEHWRAEASM